MSGLSLIVAVVPFVTLADPVLIDERPQSPAPAPDDDRRPDVLPRSTTQPADADTPAPPPVVQPREIHVEEGVPVRFTTAFGEVDFLRDQLLRGRRNAAAGPAGWERTRRGGAPELGLDGEDFVVAAQARYREAVRNLLKLIRDSVVDEKGEVSFSIAEIEFSLMLGADRRALTLNAVDLWPTVLYASQNEEARPASLATGMTATMASTGMGAIQGQNVPFAGSSMGSAQPAAMRQAYGPSDGVSLLVAKVRDFVTDPIVIFVAVAGTIIWLTLKLIESVRERRR